VITPYVIHPIAKDKDDALTSMLHWFWDAESLGIMYNDNHAPLWNDYSLTVTNMK